jgi:hypothetical protein
MSLEKPYAAPFVELAMANSTARDFAVTAGLGAGKTHGLCQWHYSLVTMNSKCKYSVFIEPIYRLIKTAAIPTYCKVLNQCGLREGRHYDIVSSGTPAIRFKNKIGHEVLFISAERPDMLVAIEFSHGVMDEAGSCKPESFDKFQDRVRDSNSKRLQRFFGGVPTGLNHYSDKFDSDVLPGWSAITAKQHRSANGKKERYKLSTDENPFIPQSYIEDLRDRYSGNPNAMKSFFYGEFAPLFEGLAIPSYNPGVHDIEDIMPDPHREIDLTFDFNNSPMSWVALSMISFEDAEGMRKSRYVAHDCARMGYGRLRDAVIEFAARFPVSTYGETEINIFGDRTGFAQSHKVELTDFQQIKTILHSLGYKNINIRATDTLMLESDTLEALDRLFQENLILLCKAATNLKRSLIMTQLVPGQRKILKPAGETHTHWLDALKYWAYVKTKRFDGSGKPLIKGFN